MNLDDDQHIVSKMNTSAAITIQAMQDQLNIYEQRFENQENNIGKLQEDLEQKDQILSTMIDT